MQVHVQSSTGHATGLWIATTSPWGKIISDRAQLLRLPILFFKYKASVVILSIRMDLKLLRPDQLVIGMMDPLASPKAAQQVAKTGACHCTRVSAAYQSCTRHGCIVINGNIGGCKSCSFRRRIGTAHFTHANDCCWNIAAREVLIGCGRGRASGLCN